MISLYCRLPGNTNWRIATLCLRVLLLYVACCYYKVTSTLCPYVLVTHGSINIHAITFFFSHVVTDPINISVMIMLQQLIAFKYEVDDSSMFIDIV